MKPYDEYEKKKAVIKEQIARAETPRLRKDTSNLFRYRKEKQATLDVRSFNNVLEVNEAEQTATIEGMTPYDAIVEATLKKGLLPTVVPELKSITIGGATTGVGIESSSFRYGLVHETIEELEIVLPNGKTVVCNKQKNTDLFYGFPNSYGTLGYALQVKVKCVPAKPYVHLEHQKYTSYDAFFKALEEASKTTIDFLDGTIFSPNEMYVTKGTFVDTVPYTSDYTFMKKYFTSIQKRKEDFLTAKDYIWRWDTDWFWCSKHYKVYNPVVRFVLGSSRLNSRWYWKIRKKAHDWGITRKKTGETVVQDVEIPIEHASEFMTFFDKHIKISPVWACPIKPCKDVQFSLYPMENKLHINFGFWDVVPSDKEEGHYNKLVEKKVQELKGRKSLYSEAFYEKETFWNLYNKEAYVQLKKKYDPKGKLKDLYEKCVKRA